MDMKQSVRVHIEELVLHGYPSADRRRIAAAVERELARLIREHGVGRLIRGQGVTQGTRVAVIDGGSFPMTPRVNADAIGTRAAQAVHRGLTGGHGKR